MNINFLEYFIEISNCGSINKAAKNLFLSQPNLSTIVKNVEEEVGFKIFKRFNRGIILTDEGQKFIIHAKKIVFEMEFIKNIPLEVPRNSQISISCTYSSTFMESFMELKECYPCSECEDLFKETGLIQTLQDVIEKKYHFSLFYCFDNRIEKHISSIEKYNLEIIMLSEQVKPMALVSSNGFYKNRTSISFEELMKVKFTTYENFAFEDWLKVLGRESKEKTLFVFDRGGLVDCVVRGDYVAVLMGKISKEQESLGCKTLPIINFPNNLYICLAVQKNYIFSNREKEFLKILKKNIKKIS